MNLNSPVIKGAVMLILTSILGLLTNFPETGTQWLVFGGATLGTLFLYFAQSSFFPSTSEPGQINGKDLLKGLLVAAGNALSTWVAETASGEPVKWKALFISMAALFVAYLIKQWQTPIPKS